jgi:uncharacterized protein (DUF2147 family)
MGKCRYREAVVLGLTLLASSTALAADKKDMIGKWKWTDYTVEVKECTTNPAGAGLCAIVIAGPKNVGMEMIRSAIEKQGEEFVGRIAHPATGEIYATKMKYDGKERWSMDGCTDKGVCAKGDFVRAN